MLFSFNTSSYLSTLYLAGGKQEIQPLRIKGFFGVKSGGPYLAGLEWIA